MRPRNVLAVTAVALGLGASLAMAQPSQRPPGGQTARQQPERAHEPNAQARRAGPQAEPPRQQAAPPRQQSAARPAVPRDRGPGAGPDRRFHRGDRLPPDFRRNQYVVDDWRAHRLSRPPRGHHWVQVGADYVLVAIATGVITQIILNH